MTKPKPAARDRVSVNLRLPVELHRAVKKKIAEARMVEYRTMTGWIIHQIQKGLESR